MKNISAIKTNIKNKSKASIFVDGEFCCSVTKESVAKLRLKVGDVFDMEEQKSLIEQSEKDTALSKAFDIVSRSMKSRKTFVDTLVAKGFEQYAVQYALQRMEHYGYIDDEKYVQMYIQTYSRSKGRKKIQYELLQKGVDTEVISLHLSQMEGQDDAATEIATKYIKNKQDDGKLFEKTLRHLCQKGFDFQCAKSAVALVFERGKQGEENSI